MRELDLFTLFYFNLFIFSKSTIKYVHQRDVRVKPNYEMEATGMQSKRVSLMFFLMVNI